MYLIIGLGNPGKDYENTRHNLGFKTIDELARRLNVKNFKEKCKSFLAETKLDDHKVVLAQPQTFMNNSGEAVSELLSWHKTGIQNLILIYDDVDLPIGTIRVRRGGGAGGHHGIESVMSHTLSSEFMRIRIGIGRESQDVSEYVLQNIPLSQSEKLAEAVNFAADAALAVITAGRC